MPTSKNRETGEWLGTEYISLIENWMARLGLQYVLAQRPPLTSPTAAQMGSPHSQSCVVKQRQRLWMEYACMQDKYLTGITYECECGDVDFAYQAVTKEEEHGVVVDIGWVNEKKESRE